VQERCIACGNQFPLDSLDVVEDGYRCRACSVAAEVEAHRNASTPPPGPPEPPDPPEPELTPKQRLRRALFAWPAAAAVCFFFATVRSDFLCEHTANGGVCRMVHKSACGESVREIELARIRGVQIHEAEDSDDSRRIQLITDDGPVDTNTNADWHTLDELKRFLGDRSIARLELHSGAIGVSLLGLGFLAASALELWRQLRSKKPS
jgi:hypothetical protein